MMDIRAFETELEKLRSGFSFDTTKLCGMYVAALARAEAAEAERDEYKLQRDKWIADEPVIEAERDDLRDANGILSEALEAARQTLEALTARVAELEAQLAAQGWRAMNTPPEAPGEYEIGADYIPDVRRAEYHADTNTWYEQIWQLADWATRWRPLPAPAPDTETTP